MSLRIAVFGQAPFGHDVAEKIADMGHTLVGVHVPPDKGRPDPLAELAKERGWPLFRYRAYRRKGTGRRSASGSTSTSRSARTST